MKEIAKGWKHAASTLDGGIFSDIVMPYMYSYDYYENNYEDIQYKKRIFCNILDKKWYKRFKRGIDSAENFNVFCQIKDIKVPTLIISSEFDAITPLRCQKMIHEQIVGSKWIIIKDVGHASMYEKPDEFISRVMKFLEEII